MESPHTSKMKEAGELIAHQHEAGSHENDVTRVRVPRERSGTPPVRHGDEDGAEREQLSDLDADVERQQVRDEPVR
jgi:hypothetical protein